MLRIVFGVFLMLHGLVHLLYFGHCARYFELQPGMSWPDGAWAFSKLLGNENARVLAGICLILATVGFLTGGVGVFAKQGWWRLALASTAVFSTLIFVLFWDGGWNNLGNKGIFAILINAGVLVVVLLMRPFNF